MGGTKFLPGWLSPRQMVVTWNTLLHKDMSPFNEVKKRGYSLPPSQRYVQMSPSGQFFWKASPMSSKVTILIIKSCNFLDRPKEDDAPASKVEL